MKIRGKKLNEVNKKDILIRRTSGENITFTVCAVLDFEPFEKMAPEPQPKMKRVQGGDLVPDYEDPVYKDALRTRNRQRTNWLILQSLKATPELEWETVNLSDPSTWHLYFAEFQASGFTNFEVGKITAAILEVNGLTDDKVEAAKDSFLPTT